MTTIDIKTLSKKSKYQNKINHHWFILDIEDWFNSENRINTLELHGALFLVVAELHRLKGRLIPYKPKELARVLYCHHNRAVALVDRLIEIGKVTLVQDANGKYLVQERVTRDLKKREIETEQKSAAGLASVAAKANKKTQQTSSTEAECHRGNGGVGVEYGEGKGEVGVEYLSSKGRVAADNPLKNNVATPTPVKDPSISTSVSIPDSPNRREEEDSIRVAIGDLHDDDDYEDDEDLDDDEDDWDTEDGESPRRWIVEAEAAKRAEARAAGQTSTSQAAIVPAPPTSPWEPDYPEDPRDPDVMRRKQEQRAADAMMCAP
jgi:hypothetical protein